jgi:hypothetical protein
MRIAVDVQPKYQERIKGLFLVRDLLMDSGVTLDFTSEGPHDLLFIEDKLAKASDRKLTPAPTIVFERNDSAIVSPSKRNRRILRRPYVKYWVKEMAARYPSLNNTKMIQSRYHFALLQPDDDRAEWPSIRIEGTDHKKVLPLLPMFLQDRYNDLRNGPVLSWQDRPIDLLCAGDLHEEYDILCRHRRQALRLVEASNLNFVAISGRVPKNTYFELLRNTKIVLSPYGLGEYSFKDFEAIYAGCLLMKPDSSFCVSHSFDVYGSDYCVQTKPDMSDFRQVLDEIYDSFGTYQEMAGRASDELRRAFKPESYAKELLGIFKSAVDS